MGSVPVGSIQGGAYRGERTGGERTGGERTGGESTGGSVQVGSVQVKQAAPSTRSVKCGARLGVPALHLSVWLPFAGCSWHFLPYKWGKRHRHPGEPSCS